VISVQKSEATIEELRSTIDRIDDQIVELLNERSRVVLEVGRLKSVGNQQFHVPGRERQIYDRLLNSNPGPFPNDALRSIYREVISACLALESPMKVAFLGPKATFSHLATMQQFGLSAELVPLKSIPAVFEEVEKGKAFYGVVPVENSTEGVVSHTLDMFVESGLTPIRSPWPSAVNGWMRTCPGSRLSMSPPRRPPPRSSARIIRRRPSPANWPARSTISRPCAAGSKTKSTTSPASW
jgi:chorismate mutase-like protein